MSESRLVKFTAFEMLTIADSLLERAARLREGANALHSVLSGEQKRDVEKRARAFERLQVTICGRWSSAETSSDG